MAEIAVTVALILVEALPSFIHQEIHLNIDCITDCLTMFRAYLNEHGQATEANHNQQFQNRVRQIRDYAHEIEDIIDDFNFHVPPNFHRHRVTQGAHKVYHFKSKRAALHELSSRFQLLEKKIDNFVKLNFLHLNNNGELAASSSTAPVSDWTDQHHQEEMVGFRSLRDCISSQLLSGDSTRVTLSVVGPPGSGKTSLVKSVYLDPSVSGQFQCRAWVRASPSLWRKETLSSIASQTHGNFVEVDFSWNFLRQHLQDKKYLIVLDDVWRKDDWEYIAGALPHGLRGSRIIVTSCNNDVAASCVENNHHHNVHELKGLTWKDARNLFCKKAFPATNGDCPPELEVFAENIVKKCEGLPLAITTVAGLVSKKPQIPVEWKKFYNNLGTDISIVRSILPSYENLRNQSELKSCFLYFGVFPEDYSVGRERLFRLWIAEGFVEEKRNLSLEEVAEDILNELVQRNLVHVSKTDVDGRVRSCRVLNLVREFIISVSEEEKFLWVIGDASLKRDKVRRLSLVADDIKFSQSEDGENFNHIRSAFVFGKNSSYNLNLFKLLKVLDMQGSALDSFPEEILKLSLLRYLSLENTKIQSISGAIDKLSLLQTLDLKQTLITRLPKSIFKLRNLRYLLVCHYAYINYVTFDGVKGAEIGNSIDDLTSLEKVSLIKVNAHIAKGLGFLIKLRKLGIVGLKEKDGKILCDSLQKMARLSTLDVRSETQDTVLDLDNIPNHRPTFEFLRKLHLKGRLPKVPEWIPALQSLIKISLKWSRMKDDPLEALENLPNLMELEMVDAYSGELLEFKENTFKKLKILHVEQFSELKTMLVLRETMPDLEKLKICKCGNMKILPVGIELLSSLKELLVYDMPNEFNHKLRYEDRSLVRHARVVRSFDLQNNSQSWSVHNRSGHPLPK